MGGDVVPILVGEDEITSGAVAVVPAAKVPRMGGTGNSLSMRRRAGAEPGDFRLLERACHELFRSFYANVVRGGINYRF